MERAFDHHSRNGGRGIYQQKLQFEQFFQMPGVCPEGGCSRLDLTRTFRRRALAKGGGGVVINPSFQFLFPQPTGLDRHGS